MTKLPSVVKPLERRSRKSLFSLLGVPISYTAFSWVAFPATYLIALPYTVARDFLFGKGNLSLEVTARRAVPNALLLNLTYYLHSLGHLLTGKAVGAPMDELIVTGIRQLNRYDGDQSHLPRSVHVARAAGGPLLNAIVATLAFLAFRAKGGRWAWLGDIAFLNAVTALVALAPVEALDGGSILKHARHT